MMTVGAEMGIKADGAETIGTALERDTTIAMLRLGGADTERRNVRHAIDIIDSQRHW